MVSGGVLAGPVALTQASDSGIRKLITTYDAKITTDEGKLLTAIGEFKSSGDPAGVEAADKVVVGDLTTLRSKLAAKSPSSARGVRGTAKFRKGLRQIAAAYRRLGSAFADKQLAPSTSEREAQEALAEVKKGRRELLAGAKLLTP